MYFSPCHIRVTASAIIRGLSLLYMTFRPSNMPFTLSLIPTSLVYSEIGLVFRQSGKLKPFAGACCTASGCYANNPALAKQIGFKGNAAFAFFNIQRLNKHRQPKIRRHIKCSISYISNIIISFRLINCKAQRTAYLAENL